MYEFQSHSDKKKNKRFKLTHKNIMLHNSKSMNKIST